MSPESMDHHEKVRLLMFLVAEVLHSDRSAPVRRLLLLLVLPMTLVLATVVIVACLLVSNPSAMSSPLLATLLGLGGVGAGAGMSALRRRRPPPAR